MRVWHVWQPGWGSGLVVFLHACWTSFLNVCLSRLFVFFSIFLYISTVTRRLLTYYLHLPGESYVEVWVYIGPLICRESAASVPTPFLLSFDMSIRRALLTLSHFFSFSFNAIFAKQDEVKAELDETSFEELFEKSVADAVKQKLRGEGLPVPSSSPCLQSVRLYKAKSWLDIFNFMSTCMAFPSRVHIHRRVIPDIAMGGLYIQISAWRAKEVTLWIYTARYQTCIYEDICVCRYV